MVNKQMDVLNRPRLFRLQDKTILQDFVSNNLEFHNECSEKLSDVYIRYEKFVSNYNEKSYDLLKKRSFRASLETWVQEHYNSKNIEFKATSSGVIIHGIGLIPERQFIFTK